MLQAVSKDQPLLLILDDLHWADLSSLGLLFHLGHRLADSRILILGAYRPDDISLGREGQEHPLASILAEFKRLFGDIRVVLGHDEGQGRGFVDALLDSEPNRLSDDLRHKLAWNTRGHPLFTVEILRDMKDHEYICQDESGRWVESPAIIWDALPSRVEGVIERRVNRLDPRLKRVLAAASVEEHGNPGPKIHLERFGTVYVKHLPLISFRYPCTVVPSIQPRGSRRVVPGGHDRGSCCRSTASGM